jgi:hypothetical protein
MIWLILAAAAVAVVAYIVFPGFRNLVDGWKTRLMLLPAAIGVLVDQLDPGVVSTALSLDSKGKAWVVLGLLVAAALFHEMGKKAAKK